MYQSIITSQYKKKFDAPIDLHTGFYTFDYAGGIVTGHVFQIGTETVCIKIPIMGKTIQIGMLAFLNSNPQKL